MLINEICKKCSLTKKAVEYYIGQGLVVPTMQENGYRSFAKEDAERLKKISVLRGLDLSTAEIRVVLSDQAVNTLNDIVGKKKLEISARQEKQKLIQELADTHDWELVYPNNHHIIESTDIGGHCDGKKSYISNIKVENCRASRFIVDCHIFAFYDTCLQQVFGRHCVAEWRQWFNLIGCSLFSKLPCVSSCNMGRRKICMEVCNCV